MKRLRAPLAALAVLASPIPAGAQALNFAIINNTDIEFSGLMVRRFGTDEWKPLVVAPLPVGKTGGRGAAEFSDPDCAFDLQAKLPDGRLVVWSGVNLCETKVVTLNRNARGELWVDYQ